MSDVDKVLARIDPWMREVSREESPYDPTHKDVRLLLEVVDELAGLARVARREVAELALLMSEHQRLNINGRCTCGHQPQLGDLFALHIAQALMAAGWHR